MAVRHTKKGVGRFRTVRTIEYRVAKIRKSSYFSKKLTINYFDNLYFDTFMVAETNASSHNTSINANSLPHFSTKKFQNRSYMMDSNVAI